MLGRGAPLPGPCRLTAGDSNGATIRGTYDCPTGEIVLELAEPSTATASVARTAKFGIRVRSGSPAADLLSELQARIRSREAEFEWTWLPRQPTPPPRANWLAAAECFFALLLLGVVVAIGRSYRRILVAASVAPLLLAALALALRFAAHAGPADIRAVMGDTRMGRAGWIAFFHFVYEFLPPLDDTIWNINRVVGALSVPLLYVVMRHRFADRMAAVGGAAALAVNPLIVRFSASDTPYVLVCAAFLGAIVTYDRYIESQSIGALALAFGLLTAAMQLRPEAAWLIVPAALLALAVTPPWRRLLRPAIAICVGLFIVVNAIPLIWAVSGHAQGEYWRNFTVVGTITESTWAVSDMTPRPLAALVVLGAFASLFFGRPGILWLVATLVANPFDFPASLTYEGVVYSQYANARYHIPAMYLACGLIGVGVAASLRLLQRVIHREVPAANLVTVGIICLAALPRVDLLRRMWTPQREYEIFRGGLTHVDPNCRVVTLAYTHDSGFTPFEYLVPRGVLDISAFLADPQGPCFVYYRTGNCYTLDLVPFPDRRDFEMNPACRAIEEKFALEPIAESEVPALPYRGELYARNTLPLGWYRLRPRTPDGDGSAPR